MAKKVSGPQKAQAVGKGSKADDFSAGPRTVSRKGEGKVSDKAGMKSGADLPADVMKLRAPAADIPGAAEKLATAPLPVQRDISKVSKVGFDYVRDSKLKESK